MDGMHQKELVGCTGGRSLLSDGYIPKQRGPPLPDRPLHQRQAERGKLQPEAMLLLVRSTVGLILVLGVRASHTPPLAKTLRFGLDGYHTRRFAEGTPASKGNTCSRCCRRHGRLRPSCEWGPAWLRRAT